MLTTAEVDRLGEGAVQIEATQTDRVGNLHEEAVLPRAASLSIRLLLRLTITDDQSGIAFDGE